VEGLKPQPSDPSRVSRLPATWPYAVWPARMPLIVSRHMPGFRDRSKVQLLRFQNGKDSWLAAALINDVTRILASDRLGGVWTMLWGDEQRGIAQRTGQACSGHKVARRADCRSQLWSGPWPASYSAARPERLTCGGRRPR